MENDKFSDLDISPENKEKLKKLESFLKENNITIWFTCGPGSDTYGLNNDGMEIIFGDPDSGEKVFCPYWFIDFSGLE